MVVDLSSADPRGSDRAEALRYEQVRWAARGSRRDYKLESAPIAYGGQAEVFRGTHKSTQVPIAFKRLILKDATSRARMRREIEAAYRFGGSPHVMPVVDHDKEHTWFVMPLASETAQTVKADLSDPKPLRDLVTAVCLALRTPHREGWIHRDLKPDNILLLDGVWKVADWGLGRRPRGQTSEQRRTAVGARFGTEGFAAPELSRDAHDVGPQADVYSIGQIIGWALTGQWPQANVSLLPESEPWRTIVRAATAFQPFDRPADAEALLALVVAKLDPPSRRWADRRLPLGRRVRPSLVATAMIAAVGLVVTSSQPFAVVSSETAPTGGAPRTRSSTPPEPPAPGDVYLQANFSVDPVPPGFELTDRIVTRATDQLMTLSNTAGQRTLVAMFQAGAFDTRAMENPQQVKVGERPALYDDQLFDVLTGTTSSDAEVDVRMPAVAFEYGPNSWLVVQTEMQGQAAYDAVMAIAHNVRIGTVEPLRFPIQLRYLPIGLRPCYSLYHAATNPNWEAQLGLCDDQPGDTDPPHTGSALEIYLYNPAQVAPPPDAGRTVGGYPVLSNDLGFFVDCGDFTMWIGPSPNHKNRYGPAELERILEGLVVRPLGDEKRWFAGTAVVTAS